MFLHYRRWSRNCTARRSRRFSNSALWTSQWEKWSVQKTNRIDVYVSNNLVATSCVLLDFPVAHCGYKK